MGIEEGDDKPINLLEVQSEVTGGRTDRAGFISRTRGCKDSRTHRRFRRSREV